MARLYFKTDFSDVYKKLDRMSDAMQKKQEIMTEVGEYCKTEIRALVPIDTGTLQSAIDYKLINSDTIEVGVMHNKMNPKKQRRSTLVYASYVEFGTHRASSQSFMRVFWEDREAIKQMMLERILNMLAVA